MKCPRCSADVPAGNQFCGVCGQPMPVPETFSPAPPQSALRCTKCGAVLAPGDRFCGTCGESVPASEEALQATSSVPPLEAFSVPRRQRPHWVWVLLGAGVMCFLCAATIIGVGASPRLRSALFAFLEGTGTRPPPPTQEAIATPEAASSIVPTIPPGATATPSLPPTPSPTSGVGGLYAAFADDVTIPDNSLLEPGQRFDKTWRVRNSGEQAWPVGVRLIYVAGDKIGEHESTPLNRPISPGEEVEITIPMTAPSQVGTYKGSWQMRTPEGQFFGAGFFIAIQVVEPTPTQTAEPPTPTPAPIPIQFEHAWNGNWIGIENPGLWAKADNGHEYVAELALVSTENSLAEIEACLPRGRRAKIVVRQKVAWVACTGNICQEHSQADDGQITNQLYLAPAAWNSLVNDYLAGGWLATTQNPYYDKIQTAVFEPIGQIPDRPCIAFKFAQIE